MRTGTISERDVKEISAVGPGRCEVVQWTLYHSMTPQGLRSQFFQRSVGEVGLHETNMEMPGVLPSGQKFIVKALTIDAILSDGKGGKLGGCSNCGGPITNKRVCGYCGAERPSLLLIDGSLRASVRLEILGRSYLASLMRGSHFEFEYETMPVIDAHCHFRVELECDRPVLDITVQLHGYLIRPR